MPTITTTTQENGTIIHDYVADADTFDAHAFEKFSIEQQEEYWETHLMLVKPMDVPGTWKNTIHYRLIFTRLSPFLKRQRELTTHVRPIKKFDQYMEQEGI